MASRDNDVEEIAQYIIAECDSIKNLLLAKNKKYGNSALNPVRVFSKLSVEDGLNVRIDDKLSRISHGFGSDVNANDATAEDTVLDLIGYLIIKRINRILNKTKNTKETTQDVTRKSY